jgi:HSP20 family protein
MKTLVRVNPMSDFRAMDEMLERFFGRSPIISPNATNLPIDVFDRDGKLMVKAAIPGIAPENLDIQIEGNVLTIRGEVKSEYENQDVKVYRREMSYGSFARSIRLPDDIDVEHADAEFDNGFVTIAFPKLEEEKPKSIQVKVKGAKAMEQRQKETGSGEPVE